MMDALSSRCVSQTLELNLITRRKSEGERMEVEKGRQTSRQMLYLFFLREFKRPLEAHFDWLLEKTALYVFCMCVCLFPFIVYLSGFKFCVFILYLSFKVDVFIKKIKQLFFVLFFKKFSHDLSYHFLLYILFISNIIIF